MFSCSAQLHIVHSYLERFFGESRALAAVRPDVPNWLQRFGNVHCCFHCSFAGWMCLSVSKELLSVFNRGLRLLFTEGYKSLNTLVILCVEQQWGTHLFWQLTSHSDTKWNAAYQPNALMRPDPWPELLGLQRWRVVGGWPQPPVWRPPAAHRGGST